MARIDAPLPQAPEVPSPVATRAIDLYRRALAVTDPRRRRVLYGRLDRRLADLSVVDTASYYRGIQEVRQRHGVRR